MPHRAFAPSDGGRCACPGCAGVTVEADPVATDGLSYLNADARATSIADNGKISYTIDRAALQLTGFDPQTLAPYPGWSAQAGMSFTVTYGFRATQPFDMPGDTEGFSRFNATQIAQAELAIQAWADVANIAFIRVGSGSFGEEAYTDQATILFGNYSSGENGSAAFANYPSHAPGALDGSSRAGDVWINITAGSNSFPTMGNYGGQVLVHEIGHAIGLAHPGDYNAGEGQTFSYSAHAEYYEDSRQYTVMSYFSEVNTGADFAGRYAAAPMLDDIAGAQVEYGANMSTRTGDTVYGFNSTAERSWFSATSSGTRLIFAVWDAGGRDTFDFSGYFQTQLIDLREGFFSNVGGLRGNVAVAQRAQIENAIGGSGSDTINGNALANELRGMNGSDTVYGGAGHDTLDGGSGANLLWGEDGDDLITGGASFDNTHGNMGNDTVRGGGGDDWVVGGKDQDVLFGDDGADVVLGNLGQDTLEGGTGDDVVRGGQGNDTVVGGVGNDFIAGDLGDDTLAGGLGADTFHTHGGAGLDRVIDFNVLEGDRVNLLGGTTYSVAQVGGDVVISMEGGGQMVLAGVQLSTLPDGWIFGA